MIFGFYNHRPTNLQGWLLVQVQLSEAHLRLSLNREQGQLIFAGSMERTLVRFWFHLIFSFRLLLKTLFSGETS